MTNVDRRRDFAEVNYKEVHDIIFPADVRTTDSISAKISARDSDEAAIDVRVWKLSPLGIEVIAPLEIDLHKGQQIDLKLQIARQNTVFEGLIVDLLSTQSNHRIAGIRLSGKKKERLGQENRRQATRWQCSTQFYPVATCANPVEFNDFIYFRLKDISASGFRAVTSLRNKFLVPRMNLSFQVSFPMVGYCNLEGKITRANLTAEDGKDYLELGIGFDDLSRRNREIIGQYLIQFGDATSVSEIKAEGLYLQSLVAGLDYTFVKTESDFLETLKLRHSANLQAGKIPENFAADEMSDIYDARSRIINLSHRDRCVGTIRATFCENKDELEVEQFIGLPSHFPRRDEIAEVGRAATHPAYRKGDLFYNLIQRVVLVCLQAGRKFVVISTTEELVPMYGRFGLTYSNITYVHPLYPQKTQHVLYAELKDLLLAKTVGVFAWNIIWKDLTDHLIENGIYESEQLSTSKTRIYRILSPMTSLAKIFMKHPRKGEASNVK